MTHSALDTDCTAMRIAAIALACLMVAAVPAGAVAGGPSPPPFDLPPLPAAGGGPPRERGEPRPVLTTPGRPRVEAGRPPRGRVCFGQAETREKIAQRRLADPIGAMRAGRSEGEALRTRLCRWRQDELVYEVFVLRRDGRIVRIYVNAQNGEAVGAPEAAEHR